MNSVLYRFYEELLIIFLLFQRKAVAVNLQESLILNIYLFLADSYPKIVLLLFNAGPLDITWAKLHPRVSAILACFLPAQSTGEALYNTLMATSPDAVPAGRLTITWPADLSQVS